MALIDYIRESQYEELIPYLGSLDNKYISTLNELTAIVRSAEHKNQMVDNFIKTFDCDKIDEHTSFNDVRFDGNPRTESGQEWLQSAIERFDIKDSDSIEMLRNAIYIQYSNDGAMCNPKYDKRNYNRAIATQIAEYSNFYDPADCLVFITTSNIGRYTEEDIIKIKEFLKNTSRNVIIHTRRDDSIGHNMYLDIFVCVRDNLILSSSNIKYINDALDRLFEQEPQPICLDRYDFERVLNHYDIHSFWEVTTQKGIDDLIQIIRSSHLYYHILPSAQTAVMCIEYYDESKITYIDTIKKLFDTIDEILPHTSLTWGFRENRSLPENGYKISILSDIPDDYFSFDLLSGVNEV